MRKLDSHPANFDVLGVVDEVDVQEKSQATLSGGQHVVGCGNQRVTRGDVTRTIRDVGNEGHSDVGIRLFVQGSVCDEIVRAVLTPIVNRDAFHGHGLTVQHGRQGDGEINKLITRSCAAPDRCSAVAVNVPACRVGIEVFDQCVARYEDVGTGSALNDPRACCFECCASRRLSHGKDAETICGVRMSINSIIDVRRAARQTRDSLPDGVVPYTPQPEPFCEP